jgi:hypothetical protein
MQREIGAKGCMMDGNHQAILQYDICGWIWRARLEAEGCVCNGPDRLGTCGEHVFPSPGLVVIYRTVRFGSVARKELVEGTICGIFMDATRTWKLDETRTI